MSFDYDHESSAAVTKEASLSFAGSAWNLVVDTDIDAQLLAHKLRQRASIP